MGVSESEYNSDVPTDVITELKYEEHIEPSVSVKREIYFNIFECSRNILDQLDVTYQRAFTASANRHQYQKEIMNDLQHERDSMICSRI